MDCRQEEKEGGMMGEVGGEDGGGFRRLGRGLSLLPPESAPPIHPLTLPSASSVLEDKGWKRGGGGSREWVS